MKDINVVVAGAAGEGIQTVGDLLSELAAAHGYAVFGWKEYESRIRGGTNRYAVRIGEEVVNAPLTRADILLAFNESAAKKYREILSPDGLIIAPTSADEQTLHMDFHNLAQEKAGKKIYANTVAAGALVAALGMDPDLARDLLKKAFSKKSDDIVESNIQAFEAGMESAGYECGERCQWKLPRLDKTHYVITGNEAIPLAAARAGCRFIAAYPMTPSTGIITFLAKEQGLGVFAEQAEDEIAAKVRAVELVLGEPLKGLGHILIGDRFCLFNVLPLGDLREHAGHGNGGAAPKCLEFDIIDTVVLDLDIDGHNVSAKRVPDLSNTVGVFNFTDIPWVLEMIHIL
jgi:2-oxoglutarate ferredoxin oxidoreductase subunit alpha